MPGVLDSTREAGTPSSYVGSPPLLRHAVWKQLLQKLFVAGHGLEAVKIQFFFPLLVEIFGIDCPGLGKFIQRCRLVAAYIVEKSQPHVAPKAVRRVTQRR